MIKLTCDTCRPQLLSTSNTHLSNIIEDVTIYKDEIVFTCTICRTVNRVPNTYGNQ